MQKNLLYKILAILGLTLVICIALSMIESTIRERTGFRNDAVASIATESVRQQVVAGPVLVIRYDDTYEDVVASADRSGKTSVTQVAHRSFLVYPETLEASGSIDTYQRYRGIHQVLMYGGQHKVSGQFRLPLLADLPRANAASRLTMGNSSIVVGVEDVRGIRSIPHLNWNGARIEFEQGTGVRSLPRGLHASLGRLPLGAPQQVSFGFDLALDGIESMQFVPLARNNKVTFSSNWAHPQFGGQFLPLPANRVISDNGFRATWNISSLASNAQQQLGAMEANSQLPNGLNGLDRFSVGFIEPVNIYSLAERATKYGLLFVALTFAAFFVFEILKRLPIHPVQYLLVGLALALFFLLLVSLSEHIDFVLAYLVASAACIVLIGFYLASVLHDWRRGMGFGAALTVLYGALYGLLISENNALILGSILLFAVLAAIMLVTRKVDWYQIGRSDGAPTPASAV